MKNCRIHAVVVIFCGVLQGCSPADQPDSGPQPAVADVPMPSKSVLDALIAADLQFLQASEGAGIAEAYRRFLAPEAIQMLNGYPPIEGRDNIYSNFADFADPNISLTWELEGADVSASGDLGYTWGTYFYIGPDEAGEEGLIEGNYVNIWRKSAAGKWQVIIDIENRTLLTEEALDIEESAEASMFDGGLKDESGIDE